MKDLLTGVGIVVLVVLLLGLSVGTLDYFFTYTAMRQDAQKERIKIAGEDREHAREVAEEERKRANEQADARREYVFDCVGSMRRWREETFTPEQCVARYDGVLNALAAGAKK